MSLDPLHPPKTSGAGTAPVSWAAQVAVPRYLTLREGHRPIIVVAPHGGRRLRPIRRGDSVNDLYTAEMAAHLAERLGAHAIINGGLDRNEIDLNRISHLAAKAPEVLALLLTAIDAAGAGGEVPLVLFVHGWNMVLACCDVGVGLRRRGPRLSGRHPTLSRGRFEGTIADLEHEMAARQLTASIGRRYAASGRDNAAQLFSGRHHDHEDALVARLARLSLGGRVDAAQLELGIALRWPGWRRDACIDAIVAALEPRAGSGRLPVAPARNWLEAPIGEEEPAAPLERGFSLQAVLQRDGSAALFCGVEATSAHSMAARFCFVFADGTMMLLVGEGDWDGRAGHYSLEGASWVSSPDAGRIRISIRAPFIRYPTHDAYLDLEAGLSRAELVDAQVELSYEASAEKHGRLHGHVVFDGRRMDIGAVAFTDRGGRRGGDASRVRVFAAAADETMIVAVRDDTLEICDAEDGTAVIRTIPELAAPLREARIIARVPVWRPLGEGRFARWTFGIAQCRLGAGDEWVAGLFDSLEIF
ncbi:MAG TPA: hypothetical protein VGK20_01770 [Candidatus Binatia bacterium]